jgi:flagellar assembly protein FliH
VEKNSSPKDSSGSIKAYKPVNFDENSPNRLSETDNAKPLNAEGIKAQAYEKGYKEGFEKGSADGHNQALQEGQAAIDDSLIRLSSIIHEIERFKEKKLNDLLPLFLDLAKDMAAKIIRKEIEIDSNIVLSITKDAIKKIEENEEKVVIKVNPADYDIIIEKLASLKEQSGTKNISIETSPSISPGGCYIETATGEIDATIETQIKEVNNAVSTAADTEV